MKAKKPLLLVAFVLLLVVLVLGITGPATAAPATAVKGTVEYQSWTGWEYWGPPDANGNWVWPNQVITWTLHGDLEGNYVMHIIYYGKDNTPVYFFKGEATFSGTLKGKPSSWSATVKGSGIMHPGYEFAGKDHWRSALVSGMKGQITIHTRFGHNDGTDYAVYTGEVR
jgi:hypothetical protein